MNRGVPVDANDISNIRGLVDEAVRLVLLSWSNDDGRDNVNPSTLMDALTNLACAQTELAAAADRFEANAQTQVADPHEPSVGDVAGPERDDIRAMAAALQSKAQVSQ